LPESFPLKTVNRCQFNSKKRLREAKLCLNADLFGEGCWVLRSGLYREFRK
jgi:hypothetical protein